MRGELLPLMHIHDNLLLLHLEPGMPGLEATPLVPGCWHEYVVVPEELAMLVAGELLVVAYTMEMPQEELEQLVALVLA